jgi:hypothetical protein
MTWMMARPERFELPTPWFVAKYSIQLSYGRADQTIQSTVVTPWSLRLRCGKSSTPNFFILQPVSARFEPVIDLFVAMRSIQLSYGRVR